MRRRVDMRLERFDVVLVDLPVQNVSKDNVNTGRKVVVTGTELHSLHPAVIISADEDGQFAVVVPLSSAQNSAGADKWNVWKKSWARVLHNGQYCAALCEQIRYVCRERIQKRCGTLPDHDQKQILIKLQVLLGII